MYPYLRAEMARYMITQKILADLTGKKIGLINAKLNGKSEISLNLAQEIKEAVGSDLPLEVLFSKGE